MAADRATTVGLLIAHGARQESLAANPAIGLAQAELTPDMVAAVAAEQAAMAAAGEAPMELGE